MKDFEDLVPCVVDYGTFFPVAQRLSRDFKRVLFHRPSGEGFERIREGAMGMGHERIELVEEFWPYLNDIDFFVFPDIRNQGLQLYLESIGKPVWGSKRADDLERFRGYFLEVLDSLGFEYPHTEKIIGLSNLRDFLRDPKNDDKYIKISRWRGDMETWRHINFQQSCPTLALIQIRMGPLCEKVAFYVQDPVPDALEAGSDPYCVDGQWPDNIILGYEKKGESYLATVKAVKDMPPEVWKVNEAFAPLLKDLRYRNFFSTEVRIKDGKTFFLDPCCRCPSPAGEEQLEMYSNFGEIAWGGANGELVQPDYSAQFCGEAVVEWAGEPESWRVVKVPEEVRQWFKPYLCAEVDGAFVFPPDPNNKTLGCIVGMGNSVEDVISHLKRVREEMKDVPVDIHVEPIADLITEVQEAQKQGIEFTEAELPEPGLVLET